ncbi:MAG: flagellar hook capping protein [Lachnospiraceae bacterium]|nr:flagellar hook capping protein [Lachnospiraceae bacterium]
MAENNISAFIKDGKIQSSTASANSLSSSRTKDGTSLDKDAFLQLLVAQMKYQDPLEPTENTEYISQLATFSELEEMQNMTSGMNLQRASQLVGKEVVCKVDNSKTGNTEFVNGMVDYVVYENGKAFVSINESLYSVDDIYEVIDPNYSEAYDMAQTFNKAFSQLPKVDSLTLEDAKLVSNLRIAYDSMSGYQKNFISQETVDALQKYEAKIAELQKAKEAAEGPKEPEKPEEPKEAGEDADK